MLNVQDTVISQYANSPRLTELILRMNEWIDPRADLAAFYDMVWNVETAQGFGLDYWGRIVDIGRTFEIPEGGAEFGFETGGILDFQPFDQAPFSNGNVASNSYTLADEAYRKLILIKAASNIIWASAPNINGILNKLFEGRGRCYYLCLGDMHARYVFEFALLPYEKAILFQSNVLPHPSGVKLDFYETIPEATFGFFENVVLQPFDNGAFSL
jgi:hypothetical protein